MNRVVKLSVMASACAFFVLMSTSAAHAEEILTASESYLSGSGNDILLTDNSICYTGGVLTGNSLSGSGDILICDHSVPQGDILNNPDDILRGDSYRNSSAAYSNDILSGPVLTEAGLRYNGGTDILSEFPGAGTVSYRLDLNTSVYTTGSAGSAVSNAVSSASTTTAVSADISNISLNTTTYTGSTSAYQGVTDSSDNISAAERVLNAINIRRKQAGYRELKANSGLNRVAAARVKEITNKFSHIRPNGRNSVSILSDYGIDYNMAGENIARNVSSPERVVAGWASSPTHNRCMMNSGYAQAGIGTATIGGCTYWVLILTD